MPLFENRQDENGTMAPAKEIPVTFRCDEAFRDLFFAKAAEKDMSRSDFIRGSIQLYLALCDLDEDRLRAFKEFAVRFL